MMKTEKKIKKAKKIEQKADKLFEKEKFKRAFKKYKKAAELDPDNTDIYDKLVNTKDKLNLDWDMDDFLESVNWTMKQQELSEPAIKQTHAKLDPEWQKASDLAFKILGAPDDDPKKPELIEELVQTGKIGTRVLIDILLSLKNIENNN